MAEKSGVDGDDVKINFIPFPEMLASLAQGTIDAAFVPEPYLTHALQQGSKVIAYPCNAVCAKTCVLAFWIARANVDANLAARFRNAIQNAAALGESGQERRGEREDPGEVRPDRRGRDREDEADVVLDAPPSVAGPALARRLRRVRRDPGSFKPSDLVK